MFPCDNIFSKTIPLGGFLRIRFKLKYSFSSSRKVSSKTNNIKTLIFNLAGLYVYEPWYEIAYL